MSRRSRRRSSTQRRAGQRAQRMTSQRQPVVQETNYLDEYRYVLADLKRIGIFAGVMLVVLMGMSLLIR